MISDNILNRFALLFKNGKQSLNIGYTLKYSKFLRWIEEDLKFHPPGTSIHKFSRGEGKELENYIVLFIPAIDL